MAAKIKNTESLLPYSILHSTAKLLYSVTHPHTVHSKACVKTTKSGAYI